MVTFVPQLRVFASHSAVVTSRVWLTSFTVSSDYSCHCFSLLLSCSVRGSAEVHYGLHPLSVSHSTSNEEEKQTDNNLLNDNTDLTVYFWCNKIMLLEWILPTQGHPILPTQRDKHVLYAQGRSPYLPIFHCGSVGDGHVGTMQKGTIGPCLLPL